MAGASFLSRTVMRSRDLSELTCRWQTLAGGKELARGESRIAGKPRSSIDASFPATAGMDTLRLEFIHPDGRSLYVTTLRTPAYQPPVAPPALASAEPVRLSETNQCVVVERPEPGCRWTSKPARSLRGGLAIRR